MKANKNICSHCGAKMVEYKHTLSIKLVRILVEIFLMKRPKNFAELGWSLSDITNAQKLRYWGLIEKVDGALGYWSITTKGEDFVMGTLPINKYVHTYRGAKVRYSGRVCFILDIDLGYLRREDYQQQVRHQLAQRDTSIQKRLL